MRHSLFLLGFVLCIAPAGCKKLLSGLERQAPIVDSDYQFRLEAPGSGWRLLRESEARQLVPDAVAALEESRQRAKNRHAVVIVERYAGDLDTYAQLLIDNNGAEHKQVVAREAIVFEKQPAVRITLRGSLNGLKVVFCTVAFIYRGHGYQIVAWGFDEQVDAKSLDVVAEAFHLLDGPVRDRVKGGVVLDAHGPGWQLDKGVFRSAAWGIEVTPPVDWHVAVGGELMAMNKKADVGLVGSHPEVYMLLFAERAPPGQARALAQRRMQENVTSLGLQSDGAAWTASVGGESVSLQEYHTRTLPYRYVQGTATRGDMALLLLGWYSPPPRPTPAESILGAGLGAIRFLDPGAQRALSERLATLPDVQSGVDAGYSLRRGTYRDFAHDFVWRMPPGPLRIRVGGDARAVDPAALLVLDEAGTGMGGVLTTETGTKLEGADYHRVIALQRYEGKAGRQPKLEPLALAGNQAATTTVGPRTLGGLPVIEQTVTWTRGDVAYQLVLWAPRASSAAALVRFQQMLAGLTLAKVAPVNALGGKHEDLRLGFAYEPPSKAAAGAFTKQDITPKEVAPIGTIVEWKNRRLDIAVIALFSMDLQLDEEGFLARIRPLFGSKLSLLTDINVTADTLGGVAAKRMTSKALGALQAEVLVAKRDGVFYGLIVAAQSGSLSDADHAALKDGFHILD